MSGKYDEIIALPHHVSEKHPQMSMHDRAAQFSPFAALTGFDAEVAEAGRLTDKKIELSDGEMESINRALRVLAEHIEEQPEVVITRFLPDPRKSGGAYITVTGSVHRIDELEGKLVLMDRTEIPIEDILHIDCVRLPEMKRGNRP